MELECLLPGIVKSPLAGEFMTVECRKLMEELNIEVVPPYLIGNKVCGLVLVLSHVWCVPLCIIATRSAVSEVPLGFKMYRYVVLAQTFFSITKFSSAGTMS